MRLEQRAILLLPPGGTQVTASATFRHPARFKLQPRETLGDLVVFAEDIRSDARAGRVLVDRILPPEEQFPGYLAPAMVTVQGEVPYLGGCPLSSRK